MTTTSVRALHVQPASIRSTLDRRFWLAALVGTVASLLAFGLVAAIIPNPIFGREIPPDGFAIATWLASAPLMGIAFAAFATSAPGSRGLAPAGPPAGRDLGGSGLTIGSLAAFFAIGCPLCNKIALVALGTSGALSLFAPIQPLIGAASLVILAWTARWTLRRRAEGCAVPARDG